MGTTGIYDVRDYGAKGDGTTDDIAAFEAALAAMGPAPTRDPYDPAAWPGGQLRVPQGVYRLSRALHLSRSGMVVRGDGGKGRYPSTVLRFDPGAAGVVFDQVYLSAAGGRGDWSTLADVAVWSGPSSTPVAPPRWEPQAAYAVGKIVLPSYYVEFGYAYRCVQAGTSGATEPAWPAVYPPPAGAASIADGGAVWALVEAHGVTLAHGCTCERVGVANFPGDAFHVVASYALVPSTNGNAWRIHDCTAESVGGCGLFVAGDDSNVGTVVGFEALGVRGWGLRDRSFLTSSFIGVLSEDAESGPLYSQSGVLIDCYAEGGGGPIYLGPAARWIGGVPGGSTGDGFANDYRPAWQPATAYAAGAFVQPAASTGFFYVAQTTGVSGAVPPSWPVGPGKTVADGGVTWRWYGVVDQSARGQVDLTALGYNSPRIITNRESARTARVYLAQGPDVPLAWASSEDDGDYSLTWEPYGRGWMLAHAHAGNRSPFYLTGEGHWRGPGELVLQRGLILGPVPGEGSPQVREFAGLAPPTGAQLASWLHGDRIRNAAPSVGSSEGWVCIRDGVAAPVWHAATAYAAGARVVPPTDTGCYYVCVQAGTSGAAPPAAWPTTRGQTVSDGSVVWQCGSTAPAWTPNTAVAYGALVRAAPDIGLVFECWRAGTTGATQPPWAGAGGTFTSDGTARWRWWGRSAQAALWTPYGKVGPQ